MFPHLRPDVPVVAVHNNLETFYHFLSRSDDSDLLEKRRYRGDRCLFWLGDPKLVIVTAPIPNAEVLCRRWGYPGTRALSPRMATPQLSRDILREPDLLGAIVEYAGAGRAVQLIPYATTSEFLDLAAALREQHGLEVLLPESPPVGRLWLRDHIDTKSGFRALVPRWVPDPRLLPMGLVCRDRAEAEQAALWFQQRGDSCVVKADDGESGLGHLILAPEAADVRARLEANSFLTREPIIVEQYIASASSLSPSLELYVPPLKSGPPQITYLSQQLFVTFGRFAGVLISRDLLYADWYPLLAQCGLAIGGQLQAMGYVGHFDLDTVVDEAGRLYLLEINARRTGGTYVHEFARFTLGADYLNRVALISANNLSSGGITAIDALLETIGDLLYPNPTRDYGVVVTVTSALAAGEFGCIVIAPTTEQALALQQKLTERLGSGD